MAQPKGSGASSDVQAVPASLPRTCSAERLAEFFDHGADRGSDHPRPGYPASYFKWLAAIPGRDRYMDAALIDVKRNILGAAISRPLTLGMWSNMKLRAAIKEAAAEGERYKPEKGWVRYLSREKDTDLAAALGSLLPEEHYALKAAVIEFLRVDPSLAGQGHERLLLDVILTEARAAEYDYILCWGDGVPLPPSCAARAVGAEAVVEVLAEDDAGLLCLYNTARYGALAVRLWVQAQRAAIARAIRGVRAWPSRLRARLRKAASRFGGQRPEIEGQGRGDADRAPDADPRTLAPGPRKEEALTFDGIRIRCLAGPNLPLSDELIERLRSLMADTQESYGIFPTYDCAQLRAFLTPVYSASRFTSQYASHREGRASVLTATLGHDVLSYVATKDDQMVALIFGHRLPWFVERGWPEEAWLVRATYFERNLGALTRADILQRCADAAAMQYGIRHVLMLRPAGLGERFFSRLVLGSIRMTDRLTLHYVPLSDRALAEQAVLARRLPIGYV